MNITGKQMMNAEHCVKENMKIENSWIYMKPFQVSIFGLGVSILGYGNSWIYRKPFYVSILGLGTHGSIYKAVSIGYFGIGSEYFGIGSEYFGIREFMDIHVGVCSRSMLEYSL